MGPVCPAVRFPTHHHITQASHLTDSTSTLMFEADSHIWPEFFFFFLLISLKTLTGVDPLDFRSVTKINADCSLLDRLCNGATVF